MSAEFQGTSINKSLLLGPNVTNQIVGFLLIFREEPVAVTGEIEAMYHQVKIPVEQRSFLRFLWWKNSDPQNEVVDQEITAHVFGGISSPSCSNYALKKTATGNAHKYGNEASTIGKRNFDVGDILKSFTDVKEAGDMLKNVRALCLEGGFNLRKFTSNGIDQLRVIPNDLRKDGMKDKDLKLGNLTDDKALGLKWNVKDDTLGFIVKMNNKPATRRGLLATIGSIYDPLDLGAPFLLKGIQIIQILCKQNLQWDDPIDDEIAQEWLKWRNNLITLQNKSLSRCMKLKDFGSIIYCTLHHFSDASQSGYS